MEKDRIEVTNIIAENICYYRKKLNLTQRELADKLNYSDKSISKWERAEGVPDVFVLYEMASFFGISLDDLIKKRKKPFILIKDKHLLAYFYSSIVFFLGLFIFGVLKITIPTFPAWKIIIFSLPLTALVLFIFYLVYQKIIWIYLYLAIFIWTLALSITLIISDPNSYFVYIIMIPIYLFLNFMIYVIYKPKKIK